MSSGRRAAGAGLALAAAAGLAACGGKGPAEEPVTGARPVAQELTRQAPAPRAAGLLATIADGPAARRRLGYVDAEALAALLPAGEARAVTRAVLRGPSPGPRTVAVRVGGATVVRGTAPGAPREVRGGPAALRRLLTDAAPTDNVIQATSPGAVQACLGDAAAETVLQLGRSTTLGVGVVAGQDAPAGLKLLICTSPRYKGQLYGAIRRMEARFGRPTEGDPRSVVITEDEIGEQQIAKGVIPVERLAPGRLARYLAGGRLLRSLLPPPPP